MKERPLDLESLKALAHPLRVRIVDALATYGASTASGLAERLGESSGSTSYHLRQLEKHGFVREQPGRGTGRERWWDRSPGGINIGSDELFESEAGKAASRIVLDQFKRSRDAVLNDFIEHGSERLGQDWMEPSMILTANTRLTLPQLRDLTTAWEELYEKYIAPFRGQDAPGSRPVQVHFNAFPVVDGTEIPSAEQTEKGTGDVGGQR